MPRKTEPAGFDENARISVEILAVTDTEGLVSKRVHMPPICTAYSLIGKTSQNVQPLEALNNNLNFYPL